MYKFVDHFCWWWNILVCILNSNCLIHKLNSFEQYILIFLFTFLSKKLVIQYNNRYFHFYWCNHNHPFPSLFPMSSLRSIRFLYNRSTKLNDQYLNSQDYKKEFVKSLILGRMFLNLLNKCKCWVALSRLKISKIIDH